MAFGVDDLVLGAIGAVGGPIIDSIFNSDNSSGSQTTRQQPATMTPDQERMWEDFIDQMYGVKPSDQRFDADYYLENNPEVAREINARVDQYMSTTPGGDFVEMPDPAGGGGTIKIPRSELPDYGGDDSYAQTRQQALEDFARDHWETTGRHQGLQASPPVEGEEDVIAPYRDRLAEDVEYRKGIDTGYADRMGGMRDRYLDQLVELAKKRGESDGWYRDSMRENTEDLVSKLTQSTQNWQSGADQLMNTVRPQATAAPVNVSLGNFSMPFSTGTQRNARNTLSSLLDKSLQNQTGLGKDVYGARSTFDELANAIHNKRWDTWGDVNQQRLEQGGQQAGLEREVGQAYTPNQAENMYMEFLNNLVQQTEDRRYNTPTQRSTGSYNSPPDILGNMESGMNIGQSLMELINRNNQPANEFNYGNIPGITSQRR